jgi:hypothetical protein
MNAVTLHRTTSAPAGIRRAEPLTMRALRRARTRHYERHVLAWYALGRVHEARAAWAAVREVGRA